MEFKSLFLLIVFVTGSYSVKSDGNVKDLFARIECTPAELVGALVCPLLEQAILLDRIPIVPELNIANITEFLVSILPNSSLSTMIQGSLELRNVTVIDLRKTNIENCDFGTGTEMKIDLGGGVPNLTLEANYKINATFSPDMPVTGEGLATISLDLIAAVLTDVKYCPTDEHMEMKSFNYSLGLPTPFLFSIEGLLGDEQIVEELKQQIILFLDQLRLEIINLDLQAHANIAKIVMGLVNSLVLKDLIPCDVLLLQTVLGGCDV